MTNTQRQQQKTDAANLAVARTRLRAWQPTACFVRLEGKCPACKRSGGYVSYVFEGDEMPTDGNIQTCGYYCRNCDWTAAGSRMVGDE